MPSKLGPMLASGKPIVAQAEDDCEVRWALRNQPELLCHPDDTPALARAIKLAKRNTGELNRNAYASRS
jgi:hypothetical protein